MANYFEPNCLTDFNAYKVAVKKVANLIKQEEIPFVYSEKHEFKTPAGKKAPLFIVEKNRIDPKFVKAVKDSAGVPLAEGTCYYTDDNSELVLEVTKGKVAQATFKVEGIDKVVVRQTEDAAAAKEPKGRTVEANLDSNSSIDVRARQTKELDAQVSKMREFVKDSDTKKAEFEKKLKEANEQRLECTAKRSTATKEQKLLEGADKPDTTKIAAIKKDIATLEKLGKDLFNTWKQAKEDVAEVQKLTEDYKQSLADFDKLDPVKDFAKRYEMMLHGRQEAIDNVRKKLNEVYEATGKKLVILGRTADTFEGDQSWAAKHPKEGKRVLQEDDWSMAVNDAFINSGLDQKAEFAMISKFKDSVLAKIKDLLHNPGKRTPEDLKKELREFAKKEGDKALFTGGQYNEGFAVSMIELEQLIDDGYVMMEHDADGSGKATPTMVPSGTGQKIKAELKGSVDERAKRVEEQKKRLNAEFVKILSASKEKIKGSKEAVKKMQTVKTLLEDNRLDAAETALKDLSASLV